MRRLDAELGDHPQTWLGSIDQVDPQQLPMQRDHLLAFEVDVGGFVALDIRQGGVLGGRGIVDEQLGAWPSTTAPLAWVRPPGPSPKSKEGWLTLSLSRPICISATTSAPVGGAEALQDLSLPVLLLHHLDHGRPGSSLYLPQEPAHGPGFCRGRWCNNRKDK